MNYSPFLLVFLIFGVLTSLAASQCSTSTLYLSSSCQNSLTCTPSATTTVSIPDSLSIRNIGTFPTNIATVRTFTIRNVNGQYKGSNQQSRLKAVVDANTFGLGIGARVSYDFNNDNKFDRVEMYNFFATDALVGGFEEWNASPSTSSGSYQNFNNGQVRVEFWQVFGKSGSLTLRTDSAEGSSVTLPFNGLTFSSCGGTPSTSAAPAPSTSRSTTVAASSSTIRTTSAAPATSTTRAATTAAPATSTTRAATSAATSSPAITTSIPTPTGSYTPTNPGTTNARWSQLYGSNPSDVVIPSGRSVLLDMTTVNARTITIQAGASLVFDPAQSSITLSSQWILVRGELWIGSESNPFTKRVTINLVGGSAPALSNIETFDCGVKGIVVASGGVIEMHGAKGLKNSKTFLSETAQKGATVLKLANGISSGDSDIRGWKVGDKLVIATTDYDPYQNEVVTIQQVLDTRSVQITPALKYMHYGKFSETVDERAEVALLTRNILIQGDNNGILKGGHMMFLTGTKRVRLEGVELFNMGQDLIGRYPIHFHMAGQQPQSYVKDNSVHDTNFRCIALHATHTLLVDNNVAYNNLGHCVYIEDGVEQNNTFTNNLIIQVMPKTSGERLGTDAAPVVSGFWITNPNNIYRGNTVVGTLGAGYWYHLRLAPRGPSANMAEYRGIKPCNTPILEFSHNKAVACDHGFQIEPMNLDGGNVPRDVNPGPAGYFPRNRDGSAANTYLDYFTAHHCRFRGLWTRSPDTHVRFGAFASNVESIQLALTGDHPSPQMSGVQDTLFLGWTDNIGNQVSNSYQTWNTRTGRSWPRQGIPVIGMALYDGPQNMIRCTFKNYNPVAGEPAHSAIGTRYNGLFMIASTDYAQDLVFDSTVTRKVFVSDRTADGGKNFNFRDDGSVSGTEGTILTNWGFYKTPNCKVSDAYGVACPHRYSNFWILDMNTHNQINNNMLITRNEHTGTNHNDYQLSFTGFYSANIWRYQPIVSIGASYLVQWKNFVSPKIAFQLNNAEKGDSVSFAVCYPAGTTIASVQRGYSNGKGMGLLPSTSRATNLASATSRQASTVKGGDAYYYDRNRNILFITVEQRGDRTDFGNFCPDTGCDFLMVNANVPSGARPVDCTAAAYSGDSIQVASGNWLSKTF